MQEFPDGAGDPLLPAVRAAHPPVNFHAYAACVRGSFAIDPGAVLRGTDPARPVLLLLRRDLAGALTVLRRLVAAGRAVAVSFKETGSAQVAAQLARSGAPALLRQIVAEAPGCLAPTPWLADFFRLAGARGRVEFIPTPYPVDDPRWDFSAAVDSSTAGPTRGIFVGTREFDTPSRQHLAALLAAVQLSERCGVPVTVFNTDGRGGARHLRALGFLPDDEDAPPRLAFHNSRLPYVEYLRLVARHQLVFQLDRSAVPGQVAGDALLARVPCVGGDGAVETLAAPALAGADKSPAQLVECAAAILGDPDTRERAVQDAQARARERLSFGAIAPRLAEFFARLKAD